MHIRPFKFTDLDQYEMLAVESFGQASNALGEGEDEIRKQFRLMRFGRMIPYKLLLSLSGTKVKILIAEIEGSIIGAATYAIKDERAFVSGVMVANTFQRKGVGTALVAACEEELKSADIENIQADIAFENVASRRVFEKQGFYLYSYHRNFEGNVVTLSEYEPCCLVRQVKPSNESAIKKLIGQVIESPEQIREQAKGFIRRPSLLIKLMARLGDYDLHAGLVEYRQEIVGLYQIETSTHQALAHIRQLFVAGVGASDLPALLRSIVNNHVLTDAWKLKVSILAQQTHLIDWFTDHEIWNEGDGETIYRKVI